MAFTGGFCWAARDAQNIFLTEEHVCHHKNGTCNAVFSDQFGEQTYIRYGKTKGGLMGFTLLSEQVAGWVFSYQSIRKEVITIENTKKSMKLGDAAVHDPEHLYARILIASQKRDLNLKNVFLRELCPVPSGFFDD